MGVQVDSKSERPPADEHDQRETEAATQAVEAIPRLISELRDQVLYYAAVRIDLWRAGARRAVFLVILAATALIVAIAAVVTAVVLVLMGAAHGLGEVFGGRYWLGDLVVGIGAVGVLCLGLRSLMIGVRRRALDRAVRLCEERKRFHAASVSASQNVNPPFDSAESQD